MTSFGREQLKDHFKLGLFGLAEHPLQLMSITYNK